jgi:hypothetical protein
MTTKHTPGPWAADQSGLVTAGKNRLHVAQAATTGMGKAVDANACLIAAAPDLLTEAHALVERLRGMAVHPSHYAEMERAITRATNT